MQTIEYSYDMCMEYLGRFKEFPPLGKIDDIFIEHLHTIFEEAFPMGAIAGKESRLFLINDEVAARAIDFVSGQIQQMKLLMDDTNAPIWGGSQGRSVIVLPVNGGDYHSDKDKHEKQKKRKKTGMTCIFDAVSAVIFHAVCRCSSLHVNLEVATCCGEYFTFPFGLFHNYPVACRSIHSQYERGRCSLCSGAFS